MEVQEGLAGDNHPVEALKTFIMFCAVGDDGLADVT
jgi:hypothetical protein